MGSSSGAGLPMFLIAVILLILIIAATCILKSCFIVVPERRTVIIERLGKFYKQCSPGMHFKFPVLDRERGVHWISVNYQNSNNNLIERVDKFYKGMIDIREEVLDFEKEEVITADRALIAVDAVVFYKISDPRLAVLRCLNLPEYLKLLAKATLRDIIAQLTLDDLLSSREFINDELLDRLEENCLRIGVTITRVEVQDIILDDIIANEMLKQLNAERQRRSQILIAEGNKESSIIESAGQATAEVITSEAEKTAAIKSAEARASCKIMKATADATCLAWLMERLRATGSSVKAYQFMLKIRYINELKEYKEFEDVTFTSVKGLKELHTMARK